LYVSLSLSLFLSLPLRELISHVLFSWMSDIRSTNGFKLLQKYNKNRWKHCTHVMIRKKHGNNWIELNWKSAKLHIFYLFCNPT
jgi:hypothetical protein